jgi:hypothetical protein
MEVREVGMVQRQLAIVCTVLLLWSLLAVASPSQATTATPVDLKERLTLIPGGSVIEVKLANNHRIRGRLGALTDSGFELQHSNEGKIVTEVVAFDSAKSVKVVGKGLNFVVKVFIGIGIVAGVIAVIVGIACATGGCQG